MSASDPGVVLLVNTGPLTHFTLSGARPIPPTCVGAFAIRQCPFELLRSISSTRLEQAKRRRSSWAEWDLASKAVAEDGVASAAVRGPGAPDGRRRPLRAGSFLNSHLVNQIYRGLFGLRGLGEGSIILARAK